MTETDDVYMTMDFGVNLGEQRVGPETFKQMPDIFEEELQKAMARAGERMERSLRSHYGQLIRERPRLEGEHLKAVILKAITAYVFTSGESVELGVFNITFAEQATHNEEFGTATRSRSLFEIMEQGAQASRSFTFISLDEAKTLAEAAIFHDHLPADEAEKFRQDVAGIFAGRHGEGIMTDAFKPIFRRVPDFGTPFEHGYLPHPKWEGWHVLDYKANGPDVAKAASNTGGNNWILALLEEAMTNTAKRLQTI